MTEKEYTVYRTSRMEFRPLYTTEDYAKARKVMARMKQERPYNEYSVWSADGLCCTDEIANEGAGGSE